jgi:hypothetical protein
MTALPKELNYAAGALASLPGGTNSIGMVVSPANGAVFSTDGASIAFDLPSRGYLQPGSMYLRYKCAVTGSGAKALMRGIPAYTPFVRSEIIIGSQIVESIQQYNALVNILYNTKCDVATKASLAYSLGLVNYSSTISFENLQGRELADATGETWDMAAPLGNLLSNCEHLVPLKHMPGVRVQLTMDALQNMFTPRHTGTAAVVTKIELTNLELCFTVTEFDAATDGVVASMADANGNIMIKSQSYGTQSQTIPSGVSGTQELVYNTRLSSIKSVLCWAAGNNLASPTGSADATPPTLVNAQRNGIYDAIDITGGEGEYSWTIAGEQYPPRPLSVVRNKAGIFQELSDCWSGSAHDLYGAKLHINPDEFQVSENSQTGIGLFSGKFYVGINTERMDTNQALLTGVSSQLSPITYRIAIGATATKSAHLITLVTLHDAILNVNIMTRQTTVKI